MTKKLNQTDFISKSMSVHNGIYSYDNSLYVNARTKVLITCGMHGDFEQQPNNHMQGQGCPRCKALAKLDKHTFIEKAKKTHGDLYNYDKTVYVTNKIKVLITCETHGDFEQTPNNHIQGRGCRKCGGKKKISTKSFIERCKEVHGNRYSYDDTQYVNRYTKVLITCKIHGDFEQQPNNHLRGNGCPECSKLSHGE